MITDRKALVKFFRVLFKILKNIKRGGGKYLIFNNDTEENCNKCCYLKKKKNNRWMPPNSIIAFEIKEKPTLGKSIIEKMELFEYLKSEC